MEPAAQGHGRTFTLCHALLKKAIYTIKGLLYGFPCPSVYGTADRCNFVINSFNPTFEVQNTGNEAFRNASFPNENEALHRRGRNVTKIDCDWFDKDNFFNDVQLPRIIFKNDTDSVSFFALFTIVH